MRRISTKKSSSISSTEMVTFLDTLGRLSLLGVNSLDLSGLYGFSAVKPKLIDHPLTARVISPPKSKSVSSRFIQSLSDHSGPLSSSNLKIHKLSHPDLMEHVIHGEPILPATGFIELLLEANANFLWDVEFTSILSLASGSPLEVGLQTMDSSWSVTTLASGEREHARGFMDRSHPNEPSPVVDFHNLWERLPLLDYKGFYSSLEPLAAYGPRFQRVLRCHGGPLEAIAEIAGPTPDELAQGYLLHPVIMDACLHVILHADISKQYSKDVMYLPSRLEHFIFYRRKYGAGNWFSHIRLRHWTPDCRYYDILVTDSLGTPLAKLHNFMLKKFTAKPISVKSRFDSIFQPVLVNVAIPFVRASFPERRNKAQIRFLYNMLDSLAVEMISRSLGQDLVFGRDESRRRYLAFARRALEKPKDIHLAPEVVQILRDSWPEHFEITTRIAAVHESVFDTPKRAVDALYSDDLMVKFYSKGRQTSDVCVEATEAFSGVLETLRRSGKRFIKILEVGAGTGLLTYHLIDELKKNPDLLVEYTVTDISYALVANLARNLPHRSIIAKAYDISQDPDPQGIHAEAYDLVVSLHVLHTAPNIKQCLARLHNLLVLGGCLLTVELDGTAWAENPGTVWFDCVFGSFPEWFGPTDGREHCAMTPMSWKQQLKDAGFVNIQTCVEHGGHGRDFFFVAQRSLTFISHTVEPPPGYSYVYEYGNEIELQTRLSVHDPAASTTIYLLASKGRSADAAVGLCAALRKETPLWDVRLAIFESPSDLENPAPLLSQYAQTFESGENVVLFDQRGCAHVSRVVLSAPPPTASHMASIPDSLDYITVRATYWAGMSPRYDAFVGEIEHSHSGSSTRYFVGGITEPSSAQTLQVHMNNIISVRLNAGIHAAREILVAVLTSMVHPPSTTKSRLAIALENPELAKILGQHISRTIPQFQVVAADFTDPNTYQRLDILFTDIETYAQYQHLRRWIPRSGRVIVWDQFLRTELAEDPSYLQRILANIQSTAFSEPLKICHRLSIVHKDLPSPSSSPCNGFVSRRASPPFREDRVYALLGGIGGLGVDLAVWMYQHGARHLVLTSRRGLNSLDPIVDALSLAKLTYLKAQDDLDLRMEACDATDVHEMGSLLRDLPLPLAGCFHMALVLSDEAFFRQTQQSFRAVYNSKLKVFDAFSTHVDVQSLDFLVAFSSVSGLVGLIGQSNYASACTALDGILAPYPNAFSLITPGISDAGYLDRTTTKKLTLKHLTGKDGYTSMSAEALWACLEDGLRKLDDAPFNQYIPDLDWDSIDTNFTLPWSCRHLISQTYLRQSHCKQPHNQGQILDQVLDLLEVSMHDFDATQPLSVYGLDSLSAAKLSSILRPYGSFSQMQLLGGVTWSQIEKEIQSTTAGIQSAVPLPASTAQSLVEICPGSGIPLIILPGGHGSIALFFGLRAHFRGTLWTLQITDSTPLETFDGLVAFWKRQICAKRPHGPYRFAAYSASTLFGVALTKLMEDSGEEVLELTFIDHCPAIWLQERSEALLRERTVAELRAVSDESVLDMLRNDPSTGAGAFANYDARMEVKVRRAVTTLVFQFLHHFYPDTGRRSYRSFIDPYSAWLSSVKARLVVLVAEHGIMHSAPGGTAPDLGASRFSRCVEVHYIRGVGHYGLFKDESVARILDI
ncbi:Polyketide synthase [Mycena venus]|uniref:Polyketide synthase n=1 Tax=Mycena venus TaxID=2733690 RepID=A0A8H6X973_9AGAR|nr:Polyketide synthase [Mycena venus]